MNYTLQAEEIKGLKKERLFSVWQGLYYYHSYEMENYSRNEFMRLTRAQILRILAEYTGIVRQLIKGETE